MIALSVAKLNFFFALKQKFSLNTAKKKKLFLWKVWINYAFRSMRKGKECFRDEPTYV